MRSTSTILLLVLTAALGCGSRPADDTTSVTAPLASADPAMAQPPVRVEPKVSYPETERVEVVDDYHGVKVTDPYRWLEDDNASEVEAWVERQNQVTFGYLDAVGAREKFEDRLTKLWDYEKYGTPFRVADRFFFTKNDGLQNQSVLYWTEDLEAEPKVLIDPNTLSKDGTVALRGYAISEDGEHIAYGLAKAGSDWNQWKVRKIDTGVDLDETLDWIKFSGAAWSHDNQGFYYSRYPAPKKGNELKGANFNQALYYHRLGTPQEKDRLVYRTPDHPKWGFGPQVSEDGRYLIVGVWKGTGEQNLVYVRDLKRRARRGKNGVRLKKIIPEWEAEFSFIGNDGPLLWFKTDHQAPRGRVIGIDIRRPQKKHWREIIPQSKDTLQGVSAVGDRLIARYLSDASTRVKLFTTKGEPRGEVKLPGIGSASGFDGRRDHDETFYYYTSFNTPGSIYRYDLESGKSTLFREARVDFDPDRYVTKQVFYQSRDGTKVPMFIAHKKGLKLDGNNPTLLYGYGGFNVSLTPYFSVTNLVWMESGGVYAMPNLRGGGEYGREWHEAGIKDQKQNVFDDFIAAAEWLIENQYTSSPKLAIMGGSNGGLLVGAAMTQRPELFGAAVPKVGVLDMLRFHKFTIGWAWVDDYGSSDDPKGFEYLRAYSPYHNIKEGTAYPATLIVTGDHDDRVVPAHSFKFAAALQRAQRGSDPVLIRIQTKAGHGAGKPTKMRIQESADVLGFLAHTLGL